MEFDHMLDPFSSAEIWRTRALFSAADAEQHSCLFAPLALDAPDIRLHDAFAPLEALDGKFDLPKLESFDHDPQEELTVSDGSVFSAEPELQSFEARAEEYDLWTPSLEQEPSEEGKRLYSWEAFTDPDHKEPRSAYLSEAGPATFDAALHSYPNVGKRSVKPGAAVQPDALLRSLVSLGLGRSSLLFAFDEATGGFEQVIADCRVPGHSLESSQNLIKSIAQCGNHIWELRRFTENVYRDGAPLPAIVGLAHSITTILAAIEAQISTQTCIARSFLEIQIAFLKPLFLLGTLSTAIRTVRTAKSNEMVASQFFDFVQGVESGTPATQSVFQELLSRVSQPWLDDVNRWIGLRQSPLDNISAPSFVQESAADMATSGDKGTTPTYDAASMPNFVTDEIGHKIFDIGDNLVLLHKHQPLHPLCRRALHAEVELAFTWKDLERLRARAAEYERNLADAVRRFQDPASPTTEQAHTAVDTIGVPFDARSGEVPSLWDQFTDDILDSCPLFNNLSSSSTPEDVSNRLLTLVSTSTDLPDSTFDPELDLAPSLSLSPLLSVQSRAVGAAMLRLLFRSHHLRAHLTLQHHFHLLGNGAFVTRLTSALFDPSRANAERKKGIMRNHESMGLRLGERTSWPPASSEVQLALMGIMSECYLESDLPSAFGAAGQITPTATERAEIPGSLNFAIRRLPPADAERCLDPTSLFALDFLRLQYMAPSPVHAVITPSNLERYDSIFKALLRLQRMVFVVSHFPRRGLSPVAMKLKWEMKHFVMTCSGYFFETGVRESWTRFMIYLSSLEGDLEKEDKSGALGKLVSDGIEGVRAALERCLERMAFALLLRKRQTQVMSLLEEIFGLVLGFAKSCGTASPEERELGRLKESFKSKVAVFLNVCRGLIGKKGYISSEDENTIERLVLGLETSGYYKQDT